MLKDCLLKIAGEDSDLALKLENADEAELAEIVQEYKTAAIESRAASQQHVITTANHLDAMKKHKKTTMFMKEEVSDAENYLSTQLNDLEKDIDYVAAQAHAEWNDAAETFKPASPELTKKGLQDTWAGRSGNNAAQEDMVRGVFDGKVANPAVQSIVDGWKKVTEKLRLLANQAGIPIKNLEDFKIPTFHNSQKVIEGGKEAWKASIKKNFDMAKVLDGSPGQNLESVLDDMYDTISTEGVAKYDPTAIISADRLALKGQKERILHANSGDSYIEYSKQFGNDDYYSAMTGYIEGMARTISTAKRFGPYANDAFDSLIKQARIQKGKPISWRIDAMYRDLTGALYSEQTTMGNIFNGLRALQTGSKLGFAQISAISDTVFSARTASMNSMKPLKGLINMVNRLRPTVNAVDRQIGTRLLLGAEYSLNKVNSMQRYSDITGHGQLANYANTVLRFTGLNHWTKTAKMSFGLDMLSHLGEQSRKGWNDLAPAIRTQLERYNFTSEDWGKMQGSKLYTQDGASFLDPTDLDPDLSRKVIGMTREEVGYAVPEANAKTRAWIHGGLPKNTFMGEMARTMTQFKAFGISVLISQGHRALYQHTAGGALRYFGITAAMTTSMGYGVLALKDALRGKKPRELNAQSIVDAFVQGGVTGLVGDFVINSPTYGVARSIVGPVFSDVEVLVRFLTGSKKDVDGIEEILLDRATRAGITALEGTVGNLWYTRLIVDRAINDGLQELGDPQYYAKQYRMKKRIKDDYNQEFYWGPQ